MPTIPQRELRNQVSAIRRAELGESFTITVGGKPVAELGPLAGARAPARPRRLQEILTGASADATWAADLRRLRDEDVTAGRDPWTD